MSARGSLWKAAACLVGGAIVAVALSSSLVPAAAQDKVWRVGLLSAGSEESEIATLPFDTLDWKRVIPGSYKVLKSGGSIAIRFQGVGEDAAIIEAEMAKAGFRNVDNAYGAGGIIRAVK